MRIELKKNKQGVWFWHLCGANGEVVASSEGYASRASCLRSAKLVAAQSSFKLVTNK